MAGRPFHIIDALEPNVRKLWRRKHLSMREISRQTGLARETVRRILKGWRRDAEQREAQRTGEPEQPRQLKWCYTCHSLTPAPCTICAARAWRRSRGLPL